MRNEVNDAILLHAFVPLINHIYDKFQYSEEAIEDVFKKALEICARMDYEKGKNNAQ